MMSVAVNRRRRRAADARTGGAAEGRTRDAGQQAFGQPLQFQQSGDAVVFRINRGGEMRDFAILVNLAADFEQAEGIEVPRVVVDVFQNAGQQAGAQQVLIAGDGIRDFDDRAGRSRTRGPAPR